MTLEGFVIGMSFAAVMFLAVWMLGNIGLDKDKLEKNHS